MAWGGAEKESASTLMRWHGVGGIKWWQVTASALSKLKLPRPQVRACSTSLHDSGSRGGRRETPRTAVAAF